MSVKSLDKIFAPAAVAVVGASDKHGSVGWTIMNNLTRGGFQGKIYPVNPNHRKVWGAPSFHNLKSIGAPVDLALVAIPIDKSPKIIRQCLETGVGGVVIISAGGRETGEEGKRIEEAIAAESAGSDLPIIGPNSLGIICSQSKLNASLAPRMPMAGGVAFLSQSGALASSILDLSIRQQIGFSHFISMGSMVNVSFADAIDYLGGDASVTSIVLYLEGLTRHREFMSAARGVSRLKPIIALKAGRSKAGAAAAVSHTGALTGEDQVYDAAFARAGIVRVRTFEELFDCAGLLARQPKPPGKRLAIVTNAGGPGIMAVDALWEYGIEPAKLSPYTIERLQNILPPHWNQANPVDIFGDASPELFRQTVGICLDSEEVDGVLTVFAPQAVDGAQVAEALAKSVNPRRHCLLASWMGGPEVEAGRDVLNRAKIPVFDTPERAVRAFVDLHKYSRRLEMLMEIPPESPRKISCDSDKARKIIQDGLCKNGCVLGEVAAKSLLEAYGIPVNPTFTASTPEEAVQGAQKAGFPVVLKVCSHDIPHKTDVKGIVLDICNEDQVREAHQTILDNAKSLAPQARVDCVTVQGMVKDYDYELILGAKTDPNFGPVILFGAGGIATEVLEDRNIALPPLNRLLARRLMEGTRVHRLLAGFRNRPPADLALLETILIRLSQLVIDFPQIREIDINPLLVRENRACAVDARVVLAPSQTAPPEHLVISPYPSRYESVATTKGGAEVLIRPIRPEDAPMLRELIESLSSESKYMRFFSPMSRISDSMLARFTQIDYGREMALAALLPTDEGEKMLAVARVMAMSDPKEGEFAVVVRDEWQGKGVGAVLLDRCLQAARELGIRKVHGIVLAANTNMLELGRKLGFTIKRAPDSVFDLTLDFSGPARNGNPGK